MFTSPEFASFRRTALLCLTVLCVTAGLLLLDWLADPETPTMAELAVDGLETLLLTGAMAVIALTVVRLDRVARETRAMRSDLAHARREGEAWRAQSRALIEGLSDAIARQFEAWGLTPAEADIAGLMLKGLPLRDIAGLRRTSEATIRQQAQGIYRKSGLANRAELSAYFLEDLYDVARVDASSEPERAPLN